MIRILFLTIAFGTLTLSLIADDPKQAELAKKPQWKRKLSDTDQANMIQLQTDIRLSLRQEDFEKAIKKAEAVVELNTNVLGADHYETINSQFVHKKFLIFSKMTPEERSNWLATVNRWGESDQYVAKGQFDKALPILKKFIEIHPKVLGENHPDTAKYYNNYAFVLTRAGKAAEARPYFEKSLESYRNSVGENHPYTAIGYNAVGSNLHDLGLNTEAEPLVQKAIDINRAVLGEMDSQTANFYNVLANIYSARAQYDLAAPLYEKALQIRRTVLGEDHFETGISYSSLANCLKSIGKYHEAEVHYQNAISIIRMSLGENHPETAIVYSSYALNMLLQGKAAEALALYEKSLAINTAILGENHANTAKTFNGMAYCLQNLKRYDEAEMCIRASLKIERQIRGEDHIDAAICYHNLAYNFMTQGNHAEAEPYFQKALEIHQKLLVPGHPDLATIQTSMAINDAALGKTESAKELFENALAIRQRALGEYHASTARSYTDLSQFLISKQQFFRANFYLDKAIPVYESARLFSAAGIDRANIKMTNPRLLLAALQTRSEPEEAWSQLESSLARGLLDQQATSTNLQQAELGAKQQATEKLAELQPRILKLITSKTRSPSESQELEILIKQRRTWEWMLTQLAVADSERSVLSSNKIHDAIAPDAAILYWLDISDRYHSVSEHIACVVRRDGKPKWERLPGTGAEGKWTMEDSLIAGQLRDELAMKNPSQRTIESLTKKLHAQRIAPVLKHLDGVKTLYIVGVNEMAGIPVELLTDQFTISYVPSGTFLARLKDQPKPLGNQFLAVGDAIYEIEKKKVMNSSELPHSGLLITQVVPQSAAAQAGLRANDVILKYGDAEITKLEDLQKASAGTKAEKVPLTIWRAGEAKPLSKEIAAGRMGVVLDREPAPMAIANRRKMEAMLASIRGGDWNDLPGTRVETNRLKQLFGDHAKVFTDGSASEQTLESLRKSGELSKYRYLHFATHGEGNNVKAFESSLILSQDNLPKELMPKAGEPFLNGQLSAREVLDYWKLNAELVTLSACETAIGKQGGGDGLLGFAQAFLTAGARSVCLSLWKVDDTATALLMSRFYENLLGKREGLSKPMGKAAALDEAKRWLRGLSQEKALKLSAAISNGVDRGSRGAGVKVKVLPKVEKDEKPFAHPKYWAAFILIGDPD